MPHKDDGQGKLLVKYECSKNIDELLDTDYVSFLHFSRCQWNHFSQLSENVKDFFPIFWRMFTPKSIEKLLQFIFRASLSPEPVFQELCDEMEIWSVENRLTTCQVLIFREMYPLLIVPSGFLVVIRQSPRV
eukprot:TRINITY_DN12136_c1_g1_i1.p1 TRINITY_DN12136_c1_g1~~TRINITY_DN12136_c1_g1_i1.p1  ORF type:complete len:132 (+),score=21.55 TRINITY_DN12136_c1_g1_i1:138-533(+)